ncbi:MAG TPA: HEAT repeat domain-containing protein [Planctomycetota bacterium]|nr:HEAT repeat domain-containing protein [Planctomycetota bacterium]
MLTSPQFLLRTLRRSPAAAIVLGGLLAGLFCLAPAASAPLPLDDPSVEKDPAKLLATLQKADATVFEKAKACQRLAVVGTKDAVPVLAELLANEQLAHYARFALEPIPDPSVDEALRAAVGKLQGSLLIGVINSLGKRKDTKAVEPLAKLAAGGDPAVAGAAANALGRIGGADAASSLRRAFTAASGPQRANLAEACLTCAESLVAAGKQDEAVSLYDLVRKSDLPSHIQAAAVRGVIVARQTEGIPLLVEKLQSDDGVTFEVALGASRELRSEKATLALVDLLPKLSPERRALVIGALGERKDPKARPALLDEAKGGHGFARVAAIRALGQLGDPAAVPVLLDAASGADADVAHAALETLEALGGKEIDATIVERLARSEGASRAVLIDLAGRRRIASAAPALRQAADATDGATRAAAYRSLGRVATVEDIPFLLSRSILAPGGSPDSAVAEAALRSAVERLHDKDGAAGRVLAAMASAPADVRIRLLDVLKSVGGARAVKAVAASAREGDESVKKAALKTLGEWTSEDAAPELLVLIQGSKDGPERRQAFEGLQRIIGGLRFPKEERLALCKKAMDAAENDEERKIVLRTYAALPAVETLAILSPYLTQPGLKDEACTAAVTIGERILRYSPGPVKESMKQVVQAAPEKSVTERAKKLLEQSGEKP